MTRSIWTGARTKDSSIEKFVRTSHSPSPFDHKRSPNSSSGKIVICGASPPFPMSAGFSNKVTIPCPNFSSLNLSACCVVITMGLYQVAVSMDEVDKELVVISRAAKSATESTTSSVARKAGVS